MPAIRMNKLGGAEKPQHKRTQLTIEAIHMYFIEDSRACVARSSSCRGFKRDEDKVKKRKALHSSFSGVAQEEERVLWI